MVKKQNYKEVSPEVQHGIVAEHLYGVRGRGRRELAKNYNLPESTVRNILNRAHEDRGSPIRPRGHNERKLTMLASTSYSTLLTENHGRPTENWLPL